MKRTSMLFAALFCAHLAHAAADPAEKARYQAAVNSAKADYASDRKLCADLPGASERLGCLKDAKSKYAAALKAAKPAGSGATAKGADEGKVLSVKVVEKEGTGSGLGLVAGGAAGALLGHQVGGGTGQDLATIAGAAGGAYAGHQVEKKMKATKVWMVAVRFNDGQEQSYTFAKDPGYVAGDMVKRAGESIQRK